MNKKDISKTKQIDVSTNSNADIADDNVERSRHDELFKKVMSEPVAAREFLEHYLPASFKSKIRHRQVKGAVN